MELYICENKQYLPPTDLEAEIQNLQEELLDERKRHIRTLADFKNYRRRFDHDVNKIAGESKREIMLALLDIIDDLERALQYANEADQPSVECLQNIHIKFLKLLETQGVRPFESIDITFNLNLHEVVSKETYKDSQPGIFADELRRGYIWNNKLLWRRCNAYRKRRLTVYN